MEFLSYIFYFVVIVGVLVFVHELGHFLAAKACGMRVERFSIGFPPRAFGKKIGETDYCVSWLPIGGYVKIAGMIDESMDTAHLSAEPQPWEYRSKPVWQRMIVIVAGVVMNIILAIAIFWGLNLTKGKQFHETTTVGYVTPNSIAQKAGILYQDRILSVNGEQVTNWEGLLTAMYVHQLSDDLTLNVIRDDSDVIVSIAKKDIAEIKDVREFGISPDGIKTVIGNVLGGYPASKIGLKPGDTIIAVDDTAVLSPEHLTRLIKTKPGKELALSWSRGGNVREGVVKPDTAGMIGIQMSASFTGPIRVEKYGLFEAFGVGIADLSNTVGLFLESIWNIIIGKASFSKNIGGPVKIAEMAAQSAELGLASFLTLMSVLSISLALINILPIPALDGGHLIFLVYEAIFRREIPQKVRVAMQQAGMVLLIAFTIFVLYNDIFH